MNDETGQHRRRYARQGKRSRTVCLRCHQKKVRCDLQLMPTVPQNQSRQCTTCTAAEVICTLRPSQKGRHRKRSPDTSRTDRTTGDKRGPAATHLSETSFLTLSSSKDLPAARFSDNIGNKVTRETNGNNDIKVNEHTQPIDVISPVLRQSNVEAFFEYLYPWCPVIDDLDPRTKSIANDGSLLLQHALALLAGKLRAAIAPHTTPREHYLRARQLFYSIEKVAPLERIRAAMLLEWWSSEPPNEASMESSFWWSGVAIRLAQDIGLHREPKHADGSSGLGRRIWWTLYARERLVAICQGQPCIIDEDYCNVKLPQLSDFPPSKEREANVFTHWVRLSVIIGHVNKHLTKGRRTGAAVPTVEFAGQLTDWVQCLPASILLPISTDRTVTFDRDVHLLFLPYLTTISLVYLNSSHSRGASVAAVFAAACVARIFEDYLARGSIHFLSGEAAWYIAVAVLSLVHVRSLAYLAPHANSHIDLLRTALKHMALVWHSAQMLDAGIDKLLRSDASTASDEDGHNMAQMAKPTSMPGLASTAPSSLEDLCAGDGVRWASFFPFATDQTSPLIAAILMECRSTFPELWPATDWPSQLGEYFEELGTIPIDDLFTASA